MESTPDRPTSAEAAAALLDADMARGSLTGRIRTPSWFFSSIGTAIAVQIHTTATGLSADDPWVLAAGLGVFAAVAGISLARFRHLNGVWLGGVASRLVLGTTTLSSVAYTLALGAAVAAAFHDQRWLVALCAVLGGSAYACSGRRWMRGYHGDPAAHARGESLAWLAVMTAAAVGGLVVLLVNS